MRLLLIALATLSLAACGDMEDTEEYQAGYDAGYDVGYSDGYEEGKEEICDEVESRLNYGAANAVGC